MRVRLIFQLLLVSGGLGLASAGGAQDLAPITVPAPELHVSLPPVPRRAEFWRGIVAAKFAVPPALPDSPAPDADALAWELTSYLASPEPEWRDGFGFEITSAWLRRNAISAPMRRQLFDRWRTGLQRTGGDDAAVLERAFSALNLSLLVATDLRQTAPLLSADDTRALLDLALGVFARETDRRGYDSKLGWVHSVAHEADLLKFLARSPCLGGPELTRILEAVTTQLAASTQPWAWREDERIAELVLAVARRPELGIDVSAQFARRLVQLPRGYEGVLVNEPQFHVATNSERMLTAALLALSAAKTPRDTELAAAWRATLQ